MIRRSIRIYRLRIFILILLLFLFIFFIHYDSTPPRVKAAFQVGPSKGGSPYITTFPRAQQNGAGRKKTIVLWTDFFGSKYWEAQSSPFKGCSVTRCRLFVGRERVGEADAVMVNVRNISSMADLPASHPPHQVWVLHSSEPPYYVMQHLEQFNHVFNWTSSYRSDADIFSPYGRYIPLDLRPSEQAYHWLWWNKLYVVFKIFRI